MAWLSTSFSFGSLLTAAKMAGVYSNFASIMAQEANAPNPSGTWSFAAASVIDAPGSHHFGFLKVDSGFYTPQVGSFGQVNVASGVAAQIGSFSQVNASPTSGQYAAKISGNSAMAMMQSVYIQRTAPDINSTQTFSTFVVASITPLFADSIIKVRANFDAQVTPLGTSPIADGLVNLCRAPNGTPVVLTDSSATQFAMGIFARGAAAGAATVGSLPMQYQETSPGSGTATQYGIRYATLFVSASGSVKTVRGDLTVEEWR